jgi:membrane dipeptidase
MSQPENIWSSSANAETGSSKRHSKTLHQRAIVVDLHADTAQRLVDEDFDIMTRHDDGHLDVERMREGGLDAQFFSIWVEPAHYGIGGKSAVERADKQVAAVRRLAEKYPETWSLATTADDVRRIASEGKLAALMGLEGGYAIDEKEENVERYFEMGARYMSPAWSVSTSWAGSSNDLQGQSLGLTRFGKEVILEMNRLGMMVDVSHVSDLAFWDIIATTTKPVIASHSNARALANVPRNLTDDMIRAIADKGGVVCVVFYPSFLDENWGEMKKKVDEEIKPLIKRMTEEELGDELQTRLEKERVRVAEYARRIPQLTVARVVDHIDHIVKIAGVENVGIGSDFDGIPATPDKLASVADLPNLTDELLLRGYSDADITKILGENILRVMKTVEP